MSNLTFDEKWKHIVFNKNITEEESLKFYETWAATVSTQYVLPYSPYRVGYKCKNCSKII